MTADDAIINCWGHLLTTIGMATLHPDSATRVATGHASETAAANRTGSQANPRALVLDGAEPGGDNEAARSAGVVMNSVIAERS